MSIWPAADGKKSALPGCDANYQPRLGRETRTGMAGEQITIDWGQGVDTDTIEYQVKVNRSNGEILVGTPDATVANGSPYATNPPGNTLSR